MYLNKHFELVSGASNILFLQNGSGMIEEINANLFQDPSTRPSYLIGVISHGLTLNSLFNISHSGFSATSIGAVPHDHCARTKTSSDSQSGNLLQALPLSTTLNLTSYCYADLLQIQLENSLSTLFVISSAY